MIPRKIYYIIIGAFVLRALLFFFIYYTGNGAEGFFTSDSRGFHQTALNIIAGNGFSLDSKPPFTPEAHFTPLYPLLIATSLIVTGSILPLIALQIVLSSVFPLLVWRISGFLTGKSTPRILAASLVAFEPTSIFWPNLLLTEVIAVLLLMIATLFFLKFTEDWRLREAFFSGVFLALSTLTRPHAQFLFGLAFLYLVILLLAGWWKRQGGLQKQILGIFIFMLTFFLVLSPWIVRNYIQFGTFNIATTGLRNVYSSLGASALTLSTGRPFPEIREELNRQFAEKHGITDRELKDNPAYSDLLAKEGFEILKKHPVDTAKALAIALFAFFTQDLYTDYLQRFKLLPRFQIDFSPSLVLVTEGPTTLAKLVWERLGVYSIIPVVGRVFWLLINIGWIAGLLLVLRQSNREAKIALLTAVIILSYAATSSVGGFGDQGRFRYPATAFMFILASYGAFTLWDYLRNRSKLLSVS